MIKPKPWVCPLVHPAADMLPMMGDAELQELATDIKANGLQQPIVVWVDNTEAAKGGEGPFPTYLLDGRNRLAAKLLGIKDPRDAPRAKAAQYTPGWGVRYLSALVKTSDLTSRGMSTPKWRPDVNPVTFVLSMNVHRRHLTSEQKRQAIAAYLKADPTTSHRTVAKDLGVSDKTAGKWRADLEARAEIPYVSTRTDSAGRKQPATKRKPTPKPKATPNPEPIDEDTIAEQPITTEPPGGLTENSPGQTDRVRQALATPRLLGRRMRCQTIPRTNRMWCYTTATPDPTSASCSPASPPISTSWRSTSRRSTPTPGSRWSRSTSTPSTMSPRSCNGCSRRSRRRRRPRRRPPTARTAPATTPSPSPGQPVRSVTERRQPAAKVRTAPRQLAANDPNDTASRLRPVSFVDPPIPLPRKGTQCSTSPSRC